MKYHFYGYDWDDSLINHLYKILKIEKWVTNKIHPKDVLDCAFYNLTPQEKLRNLNSFMENGEWIYDPVPSELIKKAYQRLENKTDLKKYLVESSQETIREEVKVMNKESDPVKADMNVFNKLQDSLTAALDNIANCDKSELEENLKRGHGVVEIANAMIQAVNAQVNCIKLADSLKNTAVSASLIEKK